MKLLHLATTFLVVIFSTYYLQAQIYVDLDATTGHNDGSSWSNAYIDMQTALDSATSKDTIWVAEGTYLPTQLVDGAPAADNRNKSFHATGKNIAIYGGFSGTETTLDQRDWQNHTTLFSGDLGEVNNSTDNAYHVFAFTEIAECSFDGVTVSWGNNNKTNDDDGYGAGIYVFSFKSSIIVKVSNSTISNNSAKRGAGIHSRSSFYSTTLVSIINSTVSNNYATVHGGGIYSISDSSIIEVINSTISNNYAAEYGGGIFCSCSAFSSIVKVTNSTITNNSARFGGGILSNSLYISAEISLINSTIIDNTAESGGSVYIRTSPESIPYISIKNSIIWTIKETRSNIYLSDNLAAFNSSGYNIFSDEPLSTIASDKINVSREDLNLDTLANNGGYTKTKRPKPGSIAINSGNPTDLSDAQNSAIIGRRDIGAAESGVFQSDTMTICDSLLWRDGVTYRHDTTAIHVVSNSDLSVYDSVYTLHLTIPVTDQTVDKTALPTLTANQSNASYQWLKCPEMTPISNDTNQSFVAKSNGDYAVLIFHEGCVDTSTCYSISTINPCGSSFSKDFLIYPNPTNGLFSIDLGCNYTPTTITITDINGRVIHSNTYNESQVVTLMLEASPGVYVLVADSGVKKTTVRLIKE